jgi:hypothetical protein
MRSHTKGELEAFQVAVHRYIEPMAASEALTFVQIDDELCALVAPNFYFKFYCAGGHGYSFTVTIGPTFESRWNTEDERGFAWLVRYRGEDDWTWTYSRFDNTVAFSDGIGKVINLLPKYIAILKETTASFWKEFYKFVQVEIANEEANNKRKT